MHFILFFNYANKATVRIVSSILININNDYFDYTNSCITTLPKGWLSGSDDRHIAWPKKGLS